MEGSSEGERRKGKVLTSSKEKLREFLAQGGPPLPGRARVESMRPYCSLTEA